jgi:competence protein ComEC
MLVAALDSFKRFWQHYPALFIGCNLLLGSALALYPHWSYAWGFLVLFVPLFLQKEWKKLICSVFLVLVVLIQTWNFYSLPTVITGKVSGVGYFEIDSVKQAQSPFNRSFLYQGTLRSFQAEDGRSWRNLPCSLHLPTDKERPFANSDYVIEGTLAQKNPHGFVLKPKKGLLWKRVPSTFSFAEWRSHAKEQVRIFLKEKISDPKVATFFIALTVGDLDERILSMEFGKIGLQHILGISGFHFALLAGFLGFFLRLFFSFKVTALLLLTFLTAYFVFVGNAPAVMRGWVAVTIFLIARLLHRNTSAINALGVGFCIELILTPLCITSIGFQLSFLCTWAILLLYPLLRKWVELLLPKRTLQTAVQMNHLHQHGYLFSSLIRESVALNLAVHIASLPLLLFLFHKFPLQSILYNLFLPFCFSLSLLLLLFSLFFSFFPPVAHLLHSLNTSFTATLLEITAHPPLLFDLTLYACPSFSLVIFLLSLFFAAGILLKKPEGK